MAPGRWLVAGNTWGTDRTDWCLIVTKYELPSPTFRPDHTGEYLLGRSKTEKTWFVAENDGILNCTLMRFDDPTNINGHIHTNSIAFKKGDVITLDGLEEPYDFSLAYDPAAVSGGHSMETATPIDHLLQQYEDYGTYGYLAGSGNAGEQLWFSVDLKKFDRLEAALIRNLNVFDWTHAMKLECVDEHGRLRNNFGEWLDHDGKMYIRITLNELLEAEHGWFGLRVQVKTGFLEAGHSTYDLDQHIAPEQNEFVFSANHNTKYTISSRPNEHWVITKRSFDPLRSGIIGTIKGRPGGGPAADPSWFSPGTGRVTIRFYPSSEQEPNDSLDGATDLTDTLVDDGQGQLTASLTGVATRQNDDWFYFGYETWSDVIVTSSGDTSYAEVEVYDSLGNSRFTVPFHSVETRMNSDESIPPGGVYIKVGSLVESVSYEVSVSISQGAVGDVDGNNIWTDATDLSSWLEQGDMAEQFALDYQGDVDWYVFQGQQTPCLISKEVAGVDWEGVRGYWYRQVDGQMVNMGDETVAALGEEPLYLRVAVADHFENRSAVYNLSVRKILAGASPVEAISENIWQASPASGQEWTLARVEGGSFVDVAPEQCTIGGLWYPEDGGFVAGQDLWLARKSSDSVRVQKFSMLPWTRSAGAAPSQGHYEIDATLGSGHKYEGFRLPMAEYTYSTFWLEGDGVDAGEYILLRPGDYPEELPTPMTATVLVRRVDGQPVSDSLRVVGHVEYNDEHDPNDTAATAQDLDHLWQDWEYGLKRIQFRGYRRLIGNDPDVDHYKVSLAKGEMLVVGDNPDQRHPVRWTLEGDDLEIGTRSARALADTTVYMYTNNESSNEDNYSLRLIKGQYVSSGQSRASATDISSLLTGDGNGSLVSDYGWVVFQAEVGDFYNANGLVVFTENGEQLTWSSSLVESPVNELLGLSSRSLLDADGYIYSPLMLIQIQNATDEIVDVSSHFEADSENVESVDMVVQPGQGFRFTTNGNDIVDFLSPEGQIIDPSWHLHTGGGATTVRYWGWRYYIGGEGSVYGYNESSETETVTLRVTHTEPVPNNSRDQATDLTSEMNVAGGQKVRVDGFLHRADSTDWYSIDLSPGEFVMAELVYLNEDYRDSARGSIHFDGGDLLYSMPYPGLFTNLMLVR